MARQASKAKQAISSLIAHPRLWDLLRYHRMELFQADLITNEEYAILSSADHRSVARLETYDLVMQELKLARARIVQLELALEQFQARQHA